MTKADILLDALGYKTKSAWKKGNGKAYRLALKFGWMTEASKHMVRPSSHRIKWTEEKILDCSSGIKTINEWRKLYPACYAAAKRLKIFNKATSHMVRPSAHNKKWNKASVIKEASKYTSRSEWRKASGWTYGWALANKCLAEASSHMKTEAKTSEQEIDLLADIKKVYPQAEKCLFGSNKKGEIGNRFELDIYIPELKKGIEFNGDYWHSPEGLKRGRPGWPEEKLVKYHEIKKEFFRSKGIAYLEIWESEWEADKEECLARIWAFLSD